MSMHCLNNNSTIWNSSQDSQVYGCVYVYILFMNVLMYIIMDASCVRSHLGASLEFALSVRFESSLKISN